MATRVQVFLSHDLTNPADPEETLSRLNRQVYCTHSVGDYWRSFGDALSDHDRWTAEPVSNRRPHVRYYRGPGMLGLYVTPAAAQIDAALRWYDFLRFDDARRIHLEAFREVGRAMGSGSLVICADTLNDEANDRFYAGAAHSQCIDALAAALGPPQPSAEEPHPEVVAEAEHGSPRVWFLDGGPATD